MDDLEECGNFVSFGAFFSAELHRRVRCLAMDGDLPTVRLIPSLDKKYIFELSFQLHRFEVNQHPIADVMPILLKSGQSASREKAVEEIKDCRSTVHPYHRSTVMPEYGPSIFYDLLKPRSNHKLLEYPWTTKNPIYVFSKPLLTATLSFIHSSRLGEKGGTPSESRSSSWNSFGFFIAFIYSIHLFFL